MSVRRGDGRGLAVAFDSDLGADNTPACHYMKKCFPLPVSCEEQVVEVGLVGIC